MGGHLLGLKAKRLQRLVEECSNLRHPPTQDALGFHRLDACVGGFLDGIGQQFVVDLFGLGLGGSHSLTRGPGHLRLQTAVVELFPRLDDVD